MRILHEILFPALPFYLFFAQAYSTHSTTHSQLRVVFSFYASTMVSALDAVDKVTDTIISKLLPFVQKVTTSMTFTSINEYWRIFHPKTPQNVFGHKRFFVKH